MAFIDKEPYWKTPHGQYGRYQWRKRTGWSYYSFEREPPKRSTRNPQKIDLQNEILEWVKGSGRRSYRSKIAVDISIIPAKTPAHIHTTVKKLLDLFQKPVDGSRICRKGLIYQNDNQIAYLSVRYHTTDNEPSIDAQFAPFRNFLLDVELADNILLRLDTGKATGTPPRAIGLTFVSFTQMMAHYRNKPLSAPLASLRNLPEDLWQAVLAVITTPPVNDFLGVGLSLSPQVPPLPERVAA